jgi:pilus assembly protein Flp/PilA
MRHRRLAPVGAITMFASVMARLGEERGATAIEYAFIASLISIAIYAAAATVGSNLSATFNSVAASL